MSQRGETLWVRGVRENLCNQGQPSGSCQDPPGGRQALRVCGVRAKICAKGSEGHPHSFASRSACMFIPSHSFQSELSLQDFFNIYRIDTRSKFVKYVLVAQVVENVIGSPQFHICSMARQ
jgi:hypothetical protein